MTGVTTWADLRDTVGPVLLIVNSLPDNRTEVEAVLRSLTQMTSLENLRVVAPIALTRLVRAHGVRRSHILTPRWGRDELELNYFLETSPFLRWVATVKPAVVLGSIPHNLYNEEVKDIFELRVALFLDQGTFLAHALPHPYVYALDTAALVDRVVRGPKIEAYRHTAEALLADLYTQWESRGRPAADDQTDFADVEIAMARHLGAALLDYDEASPIPLDSPDTAADRTRVFNFVRRRLLLALRGELP